MLVRRAHFRLVLSVLVALVVILVGISVATRGGRPAQPSPGSQSEPAREPTSYAELVAANYRVLTVAQTTRLLDFANAFRACMSRRGVEIGKPEPLNTKIELAVSSGAGREMLARLAVACGEALGGPPPGASLQTVQEEGPAIVVYLPKQCLLDLKVVRQAP